MVEEVGVVWLVLFLGGVIVIGHGSIVYKFNFSMSRDILFKNMYRIRAKWVMFYNNR